MPDIHLTEPVAEISIVGSLPAIFRELVRTNDLVLRLGTDAPAVRIERMTLAMV